MRSGPPRAPARSLDFLVFGDDLPARPRTSLRRAPSATLGVLVATSIAMGVADADCDDTAYAAGGAPSPCCDGREHSEARAYIVVTGPP